MANRENQFQGVVDSLLKGMDTVLSTKTVVGDATRIGDTIILPLVDVSFGVGAGAGSKAGGTGDNSSESASGAGGLGGKMTPSAVLVIKDGAVKLVNIKNQDAITKVLDMIPDIVDKFTKPDKKKEDGDIENDISDAEVVDIAFPKKESDEESE